MGWNSKPKIWHKLECIKSQKSIQNFILWTTTAQLCVGCLGWHLITRRRHLSLSTNKVWARTDHPVYFESEKKELGPLKLKFCQDLQATQTKNRLDFGVDSTVCWYKKAIISYKIEIFPKIAFYSIFSQNIIGESHHSCPC